MCIYIYIVEPLLAQILRGRTHQHLFLAISSSAVVSFFTHKVPPQKRPRLPLAQPTSRQLLAECLGIHQFARLHRLGFTAKARLEHSKYTEKEAEQESTESWTAALRYGRTTLKPLLEALRRAEREVEEQAAVDLEAELEAELINSEIEEYEKDRADFEEEEAQQRATAEDAAEQAEVEWLQLEIAAERLQ